MLIPKRLLLVAVCFAVLIVALGASSYWLYGQIRSLESQVDSLQEIVSSLENERDLLQNHVSTLESQVDALQEEIDRLQNEIAHRNSTRTFVFEWPAWEQNIVNGTLRMELTFAWKGENLSIIAKINDDEYNAWDYLALAFDFQGADGLPDIGANLYANGNITSGLLSGNRISPFIPIAPGPSEVHTCIFEPDVGYTFNVLLPPPAEKPLTQLPTDSVFIRFEDTASHGVYIYFRFGLPLEEDC